MKRRGELKRFRREAERDHEARVWPIESSPQTRCSLGAPFDKDRLDYRLLGQEASVLAAVTVRETHVVALSRVWAGLVRGCGSGQQVGKVAASLS